MQGWRETFSPGGKRCLLWGVGASWFGFSGPKKTWRTFRPRKKIFSPPPQFPNSPQTPSPPLSPSPLLKKTPPLAWDFQKKIDPPPPTPRTPPSSSPNRKNLKESETSTKEIKPTASYLVWMAHAPMAHAPMAHASLCHAFRHHYILNSKTIKSCNCNCRKILEIPAGN